MPPDIIDPCSGVSIVEWKRRIAQVIHSVDFGRHYFDMRKDLCFRPFFTGRGSLAAHAAYAGIDTDNHQLPDWALTRKEEEIFVKGRKNLRLTVKAAHELFCPEHKSADWRSSAAEPGYISARKAVRCLELLQHTGSIDWNRAAEETEAVNKPHRSYFMSKLLYEARGFNAHEQYYGLYPVAENALRECNFLPLWSETPPESKIHPLIVNRLALAAEISETEAKELLLPRIFWTEISRRVGAGRIVNDVVEILRDTGKVDWQRALAGGWREISWYGARRPAAERAARNIISAVTASPGEFDMGRFKDMESSKPRNLAAFAACAYASEPGDIEVHLAGQGASSIRREAKENLQVLGDTANGFFFPPDDCASGVDAAAAVRFLRIYCSERDPDELYHRGNGAAFWRQALRGTAGLAP